MFKMRRTCLGYVVRSFTALFVLQFLDFILLQYNPVELRVHSNVSICVRFAKCSNSLVVLGQNAHDLFSSHIHRVVLKAFMGGTSSTWQHLQRSTIFNAGPSST